MIYTGTNQGKYAFHFVGDTLRDGRPVPADGVWFEHKGAIRICESGLHASWEVAHALAYAPGDTLCLVEVDGIVQEPPDKLVARRRKIVARLDATDLLFADARESAKSVLKNWKTPVPQVVLDWLNTGDVRYKADAYRAALLRLSLRLTLRLSLWLTLRLTLRLALRLSLRLTLRLALRFTLRRASGFIMPSWRSLKIWELYPNDRHRRTEVRTVNDPSNIGPHDNTANVSVPSIDELVEWFRTYYPSSDAYDELERQATQLRLQAESLEGCQRDLKEAVEFLTELRSEYSLESRFERDIDAFLARVKP